MNERTITESQALNDLNQVICTFNHAIREQVGQGVEYRHSVLRGTERGGIHGFGDQRIRIQTSLEEGVRIFPVERGKKTLIELISRLELGIQFN